MFQLRNKASNLCVDTRFKGANERFNLEPCIKDGGGANGEQVVCVSHVGPSPV